MSQLSEKELSALHDLLSEEELLVKKFQMLATHATDLNVRSEMEEISQRHQSHFNKLYDHLS
ncbi:MAG: hypothetical protein K2K56_00525 [Lachnospiraceae bacterium]|nr:hypothetical protein [Lachnospiraceae bacterium]MDE6624833.1 hypothetical protein [Lachnospiraceae bacterium]